MKIGLLITTYKREDLLRKVYAHLLAQNNRFHSVVVVDDCSEDPMVRMVNKNFLKSVRAERKTFLQNKENMGLARTINKGLREIMSHSIDICVTLDSDVVVSPDDWVDRLAKVLKNPEVGIVSPNKPGCYLRLHREGYDEVEWAVSLCYAFRPDTYYSVLAESRVPGVRGHWYDEGMDTSWDPDICYRVRRLGFRVAVDTTTKLEDLGEGQSTIPHKLGTGNFAFNHKWNMLLLGKYIYKSPTMLRWEDFPLNVQFRRFVNAQQGSLEVTPSAEKLSDHASDRVSFLACSGNHPTKESLKDWLDMNIIVRRDCELTELDPDLVSGARKFDPKKDLKESERRNPVSRM